MTDAIGMDGTTAIGGSQALLAAQISTAVARKAQDVQKTRADAAMALIEQAADLQDQIHAETRNSSGTYIDLVA